MKRTGGRGSGGGGGEGGGGGRNRKSKCSKFNDPWLPHLQDDIAVMTPVQLHGLQLQRLLWMYSPGHAGVSRNEQADRLAGTADIKSGLQLGRAEALRGLRNFLNMDRPEHHSIDRLKERGVEKGRGRHSTLQGRERSLFNQANIGTVSRATFGRLLRVGVERLLAFPSATMPS